MTSMPGPHARAQEKYTNAFMAAGSEKSHFALELTYNYGVSSYDLGSGFGHFALAAEDITAIAKSVKQEPLGARLLDYVLPSGLQCRACRRSHADNMEAVIGMFVRSDQHRSVVGVQSGA